MKNAFEKYFLSLVFILVSGLALLHANSFFDGNYNFRYVSEIHETNNSEVEFQLHSPSSSEKDYEKVFIELTESEEFESLSKEARKNAFLNTGSIFTVFAYVFAWDVNYNKTLSSYTTADSFRTTLCKRYIQFEVFRI